jgi:hypothetical protein
VRTYSFYDATTGLFTGRRFSTDVRESDHERSVAANTPEGQGVVEGHHDHLSRKVDVEKVAAARQAHHATHAATVETMRKNFTPAMPSATYHEPPLPLFAASAEHVIDHQPPAPSDQHEWHPDTKRWHLSAAAQAKATVAAAARARRAQLIEQQHDDVRRAVLGDAAAVERLRAIESEIAGLLDA